MLKTERLELQTLQDTLDQSRNEEHQAISLLNEGTSQVPPQFLVRRAVSATLKTRNSEFLLEAQLQKTLDQARREHLVKKRLEAEYENLAKKEWEVALQTTIDAYLSSSVKQD